MRLIALAAFAVCLLSVSDSIAQVAPPAIPGEPGTAGAAQKATKASTPYQKADAVQKAAMPAVAQKAASTPYQKGPGPAAQKGGAAYSASVYADVYAEAPMSGYEFRGAVRAERRLFRRQRAMRRFCGRWGCN